MAAITQYATGKRKSAIARAWVTAAAGDIVVNEKPSSHLGVVRFETGMPSRRRWSS